MARRLAGLCMGLLVAGAVVLALAPEAGATRIRPGTVSLGGQVEYGFLGGGSELAHDFDKGVGWSLRVRYRMRRCA